MNTENSLGKYGAYIASQNKDSPTRASSAHSNSRKPSITISYQTGVDVCDIAEKLANTLQKSEFKGHQPWSVFNQQLVEKALEQQRWPKELAEKIIEDKRFFIDELMDDLCGLRPPSWVLVPQVAETILNLALTGYVILVGHGTTVITARMSNVFHVRLTGSLPKRIERVQKLRSLTPEAAAKLIRNEDRGRERFVKAYFHARLDNELLYDLAVNTDRISNDDTVAIITAITQRFFSTL
jgi:hypothetical protein